MIQRIQTIYLFLAALITSLIFFIPIAEFADQQGHIYQFRHSGIFSVSNGNIEHFIRTYSISILTSIIVFLSLFSIFLFKKRITQMRFCIYNILLLAGLEFFFWFYRYQILKILELKFSFQFPVIIPFIAIVLILLAFRAIKKDVELIQSINRLR